MYTRRLWLDARRVHMIPVRSVQESTDEEFEVRAFTRADALEVV